MAGHFRSYEWHLESLKRRLLERVVLDLSTGCWNYSGVKNQYGYGLIGFLHKGKSITTHRASAMLFKGFDLNSRMHVLHHCDNPSCFNPEHLFVGTHSDNFIDAAKKNRLSSKLTPDDVRLIRSGYFGGKTQAYIADKLNVSESVIWGVIHNKSHVWVTAQNTTPNQ